MRIALIHALEESVAPARAAMAAEWPAAAPFDLLETSLAPDLAAAGGLDESLIERFGCLAEYAAGTRGQGGATAGILFTCSAFGPAIEAAARRVRIPVLDPVSPALREALGHGESIGLVLSFAPSAPPLVAALQALAAQGGRHVDVRVAVAEGALDALKRGDAASHDARVAAAAATLPRVDALLLGQFSLARAAAAVGVAVPGTPVLTTPACAVRALRRRVDAAA